MIFSIIVPFYNVEKYIEQCLRSLISQNYSENDFEIIAVDDCSIDGSRQIVENLMTESQNLHLITHSINKRQGGARNTGIMAAKGEWIFFVDSDDYWISKNVLRNFRDMIVQNPELQLIKSVSYSGINTTDSALQVLKITSGIEYLCSDNYLVNIWDGCYNKNFIQKHSLLFRENAVFEDSDWTLKVVLKSEKILLINYPFYAYRINTNSTTNGYSYAALRDNITSAFIIEKIIKENELSENAIIVCRNFILMSIMTFVKISRNYSNKDAIEQLSRLKGKNIIDQHNYRLSYIQKGILYLLNHNVPLLVWLVKVATKGKRIVNLLRIK